MKNVIYQASLRFENQGNEETHSYIGLTEKPFSQRLAQHISSFRTHDPRNATCLSKKVLQLQRNHILFEASWKILQSASSYKPGGKECRLCLTEIY